MVRKEFNLSENEKWLITKLRIMLVRLDAGLELLQIRKSDNPKSKRGKIETPDPINKREHDKEF